MLTGYLYINFYNNTYTTAVCACVRGTGGRVCGGYLFAPVMSCSVDVVSRNK